MIVANLEKFIAAVSKLNKNEKKKTVFSINSVFFFFFFKCLCTPIKHSKLRHYAVIDFFFSNYLLSKKNFFKNAGFLKNKKDICKCSFLN